MQETAEAGGEKTPPRPQDSAGARGDAPPAGRPAHAWELFMKRKLEPSANPRALYRPTPDTEGLVAVVYDTGKWVLSDQAGGQPSWEVVIAPKSGGRPRSHGRRA